MLGDVDIVNLALAHLGDAKTISSLTEQTTEAIGARRYLAMAKSKVFASHDWRFASVTEVLALKSTPYFNWLYAYQYPAFASFIREVMHPDYPDIKQPYDTVMDADGTQAIVTQVEKALVRYTHNGTLGGYPDLFAEAVSFYLAYYMAGNIITTDVSKQLMMQGYMQSIGFAANNDGNQRRVDPHQMIPDSIAERFF